MRLIRGAKEKAKQTRQTKSTYRNKFLSRLTVPRRGKTREKEGRSRPLVVQSSRNVDAGVDATGKWNLHPLTSQPSLTLSHDPSVQLISQEMYSHTRTGPRAYFRFRDTRNACTMRCVATPRADWSRRFPFWIHGITGRRGSSDGPHPAALPLPPSAVYPYWRELEATWCAIVDRSTLATFQGCEYISTWNCCRGYFLRMPWELLLFFFFLFGVTFRC